MEEQEKKVLDLALKAGNLLLENGGEIYRVEETMQRIARYYGIKECDPFVLSSGIFLSGEDGKSGMYAKVRHIPISAVHFHKVTAVNQLSREIEEGHYTVEEAAVRLEEIRNMPGKKNWTRVLASGFGCGGFGYILGGTIYDVMASFLVGIGLYIFLLWMEHRKKQTSKLVLNICGGFLVTLLSRAIFAAGMGSNIDFIIAGAVMPLVPGVSFVNGIRDLADGDYIAGSVRMLDALLVTFGIALGVGMYYMIALEIGGLGL